jgi:hypothetical protein
VEEHVSTQRLHQVATSNDIVFTLEEFNHLKGCPFCFQQWKDFISTWNGETGPENRTRLPG